jgi:diguanylate cyclase (GGDEF)-like protein/PAS domain S-box-containing protein
MTPYLARPNSVLRLHPSHLRPLRNALIVVALLALVLAATWLEPPSVHDVAGYLPLHILLETVAIVVAMLVFAVGWNAQGRDQSGSVILLACAFFGVGWLDFFHVLSYKGMPDFVSPSDTEKGLAFWLAARLMASVVLFVVAVRPWRPFNSAASKYILFAAFIAMTAYASWLFLLHLEWMPRTFVPGQGLTAFKVNFEYALILLNLATAVMLWSRMREPLPFNASLLLAAVIVMAMSEFLFTLYVTTTDIFNVLGHIYKVAAYLFLYRAVVVENIEHPYNQLRESENQLLATMNAIPDPLFELDLSGRYWDCRAVQTGPLAAPADDFIGKTVFNVMPAGAAEVTMSALHEAYAEGRSHGKEIELSEADNNKRWFELSVSRKHAARGQAPRFILLTREITERKRSEDKLRMANTLVENSPTVLFRWKAEEGWPVEYVSENVLQQFGYAAADLRSGRVHFSAMIYPDDVARVAAEVAQYSAIGAERFTQEYRIVTADGKVRWIDNLTTIERDENGKVLHYEGVVLDKTERRFAEDALLKLSQAVEQSPNPIVISDLDSNIEYANPAFTRVTGFSLEEVRGQNQRMLQSGKTPRATYDDMWTHLKRGDNWKGEFINRRKDGSEYTEMAWISPVRQPDGSVTNYLSIKEDITEKKKAEEWITKLAHFDLLTELPNRTLLNEHVRHDISVVQRSNLQLAVMFLDLDNFKNINDTLGHSVGDEMLIQLAKRLKSAIREEDTVSRLGGDEFVLIFPGTTANSAAQLAEKILAIVATPYRIAQQELIVTTSIGIAMYPGDGADFEALSKNADVAMYRAKHDGRNNYRFFAAEMQLHSARALQLDNALRYALQRDQLRVYYQPQVAIADGRVIGAEALLRWEHPELGMISPAEFIPVAENGGQMLSIGEWVLRTAVQQLKTWMDSGLPPMIIAVNLSAVQFKHPNLPDLVSKILHDEKLSPQYLELELTESVAMDDPQGAIAVMNELYGRGIRMSLDDFGTGYSSLSMLKKFKVYKLKIDQSFVRDITEDADDKAIVTAIINMASSLGFQTIAEGVETQAQLDLLRLHGCNEVQGYYFSKPLPAEEFEAFVRARPG